MVTAHNVVTRYRAAKLDFTIPRPLHLPPQVRGKEPIVPEGTDLAIWTWEENGKPYGIAFQGKSNKPLWYYSFRNESSRDQQIEESTKSRLMVLKYKQDRKDERKNYKHDHEVGDIFYTSWGYDQTNVDFYQVTEVKGKQLVIREIAKSIKEEGLGSDLASGIKDKFIGPPMRVNPKPGGSLTINGHHGSKWTGKGVYQTPFGQGH